MKELWNFFDDNHNRIAGLTAILGLLLLVYTTFFQPPATIPFIKDDKNQTIRMPEKITDKNKSASKYFFTAIGVTILGFSSVLLYKKFKRRKPFHRSETGFSKASKYWLNTRNLILDYAEKEHVIVSPVKFANNTTIDDIIELCAKVHNPDKNQVTIERCLRQARINAYTRKYSFPSQEDEKIMGINTFDQNGNKRGKWEIHFLKVLERLGISDFSELRIIDVGMGNANAYPLDLFSKAKTYFAVDISEPALEFAKKKFPNLKYKPVEAEDLKGIPNNSFDLYLSFRTYQSTLFNRRQALIEARRVLSPGGSVIISIPILLYTDGEFKEGLCDITEKPSMEYAEYVTDSIRRRLDVPGFTNIGVYKNSPYEYFLYAQLIE